LYIGNLPFDTTERELRTLFEKFGPVELVNIIEDTRGSGRKNKGFGFVVFKERADAEEAIKDIDGCTFGGRPMQVTMARERGSFEPRRGRGYGGPRYGRGGYGRGGYGGGWRRRIWRIWEKKSTKKTLFSKPAKKKK